MNKRQEMIIMIMYKQINESTKWMNEWIMKEAGYPSSTEASRLIKAKSRTHHQHEKWFATKVLHRFFFIISSPPVFTYPFHFPSDLTSVFITFRLFVINIDTSLFDFSFIGKTLLISFVKYHLCWGATTATHTTIC